VVWSEGFNLLLNSLGTCILEHLVLQFSLGVDHYAALFEACTGRRLDEVAALRMSDRVLALQRSVAGDAGFTARDDTWPRRFFDEAIEEGPARGRRVDQLLVAQTVEAYYRARGWDPAAGRPYAQTLAALGLVAPGS
jgi:aldehyde:ferredoxin oxidoreductase